MKQILREQTKIKKGLRKNLKEDADPTKVADDILYDLIIKYGISNGYVDPEDVANGYYSYDVRDNSFRVEFDDGIDETSSVYIEVGDLRNWDEKDRPDEEIAKDEAKLKKAASIYKKAILNHLIADASEMEDDEDEDEFDESFDWSVFGKYAPLSKSRTLNEAPFLGDVDDYDDETLAADLKRISTASLLRKYPAIAALQKLMGLHLEYQGLSSAFKYVSRDIANAEVLQSPYKGATLQVYIGGIYEASYDDPGSGLAKQSWYVVIIPKEGSPFWYRYKNPSKVNEKKLKELQDQIDAELGITKLDNKALTKQLEKQVKQICDTFDESSAWSGKSSGGWTIEVKEWKDRLVCRAVAKELPLAFYNDPDSDATEVQWRGVNTSNEKETDLFSIADRLKLVMATAQVL